MNEPLRILLVEDNPEDATLIRSHLESVGSPFTMTVTCSLGEASEALASAPVDVVLLDLALPDSTGIETFTRMQVAAAHTPIVVLTATDDETVGLRAVKAGAEDYLVKGQVDGTLLWRALRYGVERRRAARRIDFQSQLLAQVGQAVVASDNNDVIQYWNAAAESLFGWSAAEAIGQPVRSILPVDFAANEGGADLSTSPDAWSGEVTTRRKDGRPLLVSVTMSKLRDRTGAIIGRVGVSVDVTEQRAAEHAMRASELRLRLFVDSLPTIMWTTDVDLRITSMRGAGMESVRHVIGDGVGRNVADFALSPEHVQSHRALGGETVTAMVQWGGRTFDIHVEPLRDPDGTIIGTIGIALDVTEHRRSEREAAQYFELLLTIVEAAPLAIIVIDENGLVSLWNRAAERMFGWTSSEVIGQPSPHVPVDARDAFDRSRARVRELGRAHRVVDKRVTRDGRLLDVAVTAAPVHGADGRYHGTMGIVEDITQERLSEERQQRLNAIIEASPDFVGTFDVERRTLFMNRSGRELLGLRPDEDIANTTLERFCTPATAALLERTALPRALAEDTWSGEATLRATGGAEVHVWLTLVAHRRANGDLAFISAVAQDVSERRFLEEQLRQSQKMEAVGRLAGGVAHDFNNLLTAIAGHAELLLEDLGHDAKTRDDIEEVLRAVDRASALTRQLLAFSRKQVLQPTTLDVNQVITDLGRLLRRLIGEDVELRMNLTRGMGWVRADRGQIEQVVMNLVVNARDALPHGGTVEVRTVMTNVVEDSDDYRRGVAIGTFVEIAVADDGVGMDEALVSRIFEPFFTTKEQGRGTGLGLPTAFGIAAQSGGHMLVDSESGKGSVFRVLLPIVDETAEDTTTPASDRPDANGSETVLLVEDEAAVRRLGCRILERKGYSVLEADSGATAIRLFEQMAPGIALLITDVVMPGMSGTELARRIRAMKPTLPVLFTSGYTADAIARDEDLEPGTAFLEKPFTPDALAQKVRDILNECGD